MSRKDYNKFVVVLNKAYKNIYTESSYETWNEVVKGMADVLEKDNPNFKRDTFIKACRR